MSRLLKESILAQLHAQGIQENQALLVAVSGGPDSVALLHALYICRQEGQCGPLFCAHMHHGLRESADGDAEFVQSLAKEWDIPCIVEHADIRRHAKEHNMTVEEAARSIRYAFLHRAKQQSGAACIVTAHHMDDQAETILLHLLRGCGLKGLCGMQVRSGEVLRPLLQTTRAGVMQYIKENGLAFRVDETNGEMAACARNRIRLELLPILKDRYNPNIVEGLSNMAALLSEDEAYLQGLAVQALQEAELCPQSGAYAKKGTGTDNRDNIQSRGAYVDAPDGESISGIYSRSKLLQLPAPIQSRAIRLALSRAGALYDMQRGGIESLRSLLRARTGAYRALPDGYRAWVSYDMLYIGKAGDEVTEEFTVRFRWPGETVTPAGIFHTTRVHALRMDEGPFTAYMDADRLPENVVARIRRDGDRFYPLGAPGGMKLKAYFINKKIPRAQRRLPLLATGGEVLFYPGGTVSELVRVQEKTQCMLRVAFTENTQIGKDERE